MYLPKRFGNSNLDRSLAVMRGAPLATLVSVDADHQPFISHLPLIIEQEEANLVIVGHLARANAHWRLLAGREATAIFHGPNSYITPQWYTENDVPTWNYAVVHARGPVTLIEDRAGIVRCLEKLTAVVEDGMGRWQFWIPDDLAGGVERHIVGFQMQVKSLLAKFKLSQNRSAADRAGVMRGLGTRADDGSRGILALMEQWEMEKS
ncbi:MAG: FMN-binding negative transcriptional regulator [Vicinamibacterales bacterium]